MRQVVLDTETTGLEWDQGHRIIEIGGVELIDRQRTGAQFHEYVNPQREIDQGALQVHGITQDFLAAKPVFAEVAEALVRFVEGAELIIHNAPFDLGFLNHELSLLPGGRRQVEKLCKVTDSLALARSKWPGQKNNLDALCRRCEVDNSARTNHGALLDAEILADVYLAMTGGQTDAFGGGQGQELDGGAAVEFEPLPADRPKLKVIVANAEELARHERMMARLAG